MTKSKQTLRVKVTEYGEQQLEALGLPTRMEFELNDGTTVELLHTWLWDDDRLKAYEEAAKSNDGEPRDIRLARAALGPEEHARFIAGGGKSNLVAIAIEMMKRPKDDSDPKGR
jgi:hypothetical protein